MQYAHHKNLTERVIPDEANLPVMLKKTPKEKYDKRILLSSVLTPQGLTPAPAGSFDLRGAVPTIGKYGPYGNNTFGDCFEAAMLHYEQQITNYRGNFVNPPQICGNAAYRAITGWNGTGIGGGTDPFAAMSYWRKNGLPINAYQPAQLTSSFTGHIVNNVLFFETTPTIPLAIQEPLLGSNIPPGVTLKTKNSDGTFTIKVPVTTSTPLGFMLNVPSESMTAKVTPPPVVTQVDIIKAYLWIDSANYNLFRDATYNFVGSLLTLNMPKAWQNQAIWDAPPAGVPTGPGTPWAIDSWGGHEVLVIEENTSVGVLVDSWDHQKLITPAAWKYVGPQPWPQSFLTRYVGNAVVPLSNLLFDPTSGLAPDGLDIAALDAAIAALGGTA